MRRSLATDRFALLRPLAEGGLTSAEAEQRYARFGANDILETAQHRWLDVARDTAKDPMIWFLLATGTIYGILGDFTEALTLTLSIVPLVAMDLVLHRRTQASTASLRSQLASHATVDRDGRRREVPVSQLVPGDLVIVPTGEPFPADGIVVGGDGLQVDESALTGEAYPVRKRSLEHLPHPAAADRPVAVDDEHWGLAGTRLLTGTALLRVIYTGGETLYGEIVRSARRGSHARTPLQAAIANLVRGLLVAAGALCLILAWVRLTQGFGWVDALVSAATLAVAALPEEFPLVFVMFLGVGVYRLARRQALVRRSVSVENIGRVTCICSDKTGTITAGELHLTHLVAAPDLTDSELLECATLASREESGDPLDQAILRAATVAGIPTCGLRTLATFPFTEDRRRESTVVETAAGARAFTKGSPEAILPLCTGIDAGRWSDRVARLADEGHKVIAGARRPIGADDWAGGEPDRGFQLCGLLALEDPVRDGVREAIAECREAGIQTVMVTGDHPATATAVAREIGLGEGAPMVVSGDELEAVLRDISPEKLRRLNVVARAVPAQKLALVRAFQEIGEIVAVTGDGVNDVPALQVADVGVAMGERATRSAREVAAIVLLDDSFRTLVRAIAEGRQLFRNLRLSFHYLLAIHIPLVLTAALIPLAGYPLLYLPIHIVWLELVIHPTAMLAFQELPAAGPLRQARRRGRVTFFSRLDWFVIALVGSLLTLMITFTFDHSVGAGDAVGHARALALVALNVASATLAAILTRLRTRPAQVLVAGTLALAVLLVQLPTTAMLLHVEPLHLRDWGLAAGGAVLACLPAAAVAWVRGR